MTVTVALPKDILPLQGQTLPPSEWIEVPQADIDGFGRATHDEQWIHLDVERAKSGPFGGTIAHGYMTLALLIPMWSDVLEISDLGMAVNYGLNKVRFPAPVPAGSKVRLTATLTEVTEVAGGGVQTTVSGVVECDQSKKPVVVAEMLFRYYP